MEPKQKTKCFVLNYKCVILQLKLHLTDSLKWVISQMSTKIHMMTLKTEIWKYPSLRSGSDGSPEENSVCLLATTYLWSRFHPSLLPLSLFLALFLILSWSLSPLLLFLACVSFCDSLCPFPCLFVSLSISLSLSVSLSLSLSLPIYLSPLPYIQPHLLRDKGHKRKSREKFLFFLV